MHELNAQRISLLVGGDPLRRWVAQDGGPRTRAWYSDDGTVAAIARPALAQRDRVLMIGEPDAATVLLRELLPVLGPTYRPFGDRRLIEHLVSHLPELERRGDFYWMWRSGGHEAHPELHTSFSNVLPAQRISPYSPVRWAGAGELPAIAALMSRDFPDSYAQPGRDGVHRWARIALGGRVVAAGAWAWSTATVGLISGVTVESPLRGKGFGRAVATFLVHEALHTFGTVGLLADEGNLPALTLYRSMGLRSTPLLAAKVRGH